MLKHHPLRFVTIALATLLSLTCSTLTTAHAEPSHAAPDTNFVVRAAAGYVDCNHVAEQCETLRSHLVRTWHQSSDVQWNPRCEVVIHLSRDSYRDHVGPGSDQTSGSSLIRFGNEGVVHRRIDLLADSKGNLTALPHELTHVILADLFGGRKPPPWLDEGIATLADSKSKQSLHHRDCRTAIESGAAFRVTELFALERLSHPDQVAAFYGQSLSLTRFLVERNKPQELVHFVRHAMNVGYDAALRKHYGFATVADLEQAWRRFEQTKKTIHEGLPGGEGTGREPFEELITLNR